MEKPTSYNLPLDKSLRTGVAWIDAQHTQLLDNLANMASAIAQNKCEQNVRSIISFLNEYIRSHFNNELSYMQRFNYPQTADHLAQHQRFIKTFKEKEKKYILHGASRQLAGEITRDLWDWFKSHICEFDQELAVFLKKRKSRQGKTLETDENNMNTGIEDEDIASLYDINTTEPEEDSG